MAGGSGAGHETKDSLAHMKISSCTPTIIDNTTYISCANQLSQRVCCGKCYTVILVDCVQIISHIH